MRWTLEPSPCTEIAMHFAGFSAGSYTAIALEVDYQLLCQHFQLPLCPGTTTEEPRYDTWSRFSPRPSSLILPACSLRIGYCVSHTSGKTSSASGTQRSMSFGPFLPPFGRKILALPCSYRFSTLATRTSLNGLAKRSTTMAIYFA